MPLRTDSRQQARLQNVPVLPTLPDEPSLETAYTSSKTEGLTRVFQNYDRERKTWASRVGQHLGRIQDALVKLSSARSGGTVYTNRGWAKMWRSAQYVIDHDYSGVLRPKSATIALLPYWSSGLDEAYDVETALNAGDTPPTNDSVVVGVEVKVTADSTEDLSPSRGVLRVTLTPTYNSDRGSDPARQVRVIQTSYAYSESDWHQFHYFEPFFREDPYPNPVYWKDLGIASVYAELV